MNWTERTELLIGKDGLRKLKKSHVLIAGLGGVGGYAAEQLARAGIGKLTLLDADVINPSNINRQIIALSNNIGQAKTDEFKKRLLLINPQLEIILYNDFLKDEKIPEIVLQNNYDYVVDAIDTLSPKIHFIRECYENKIPFVSSMGAGGKTDPLKVSIADISETYNCNLARHVRQNLSKKGIKSGVKTVFSIEKTDKNSVILEENQNKKSNVGTISYMPALFGIFCASIVIRDLISDA